MRDGAIEARENLSCSGEGYILSLKFDPKELIQNENNSQIQKATSKQTQCFPNRRSRIRFQRRFEES